MVDAPHRLWCAQVFHQRHFPKKNRFCYRIFYTLLDMQHIDTWSNRWFSRQKIALLRYYDRDHGRRDGSCALTWANNLFKEKKIEVDRIQLLTLPRVLGYFFCPVSFWLGFQNHQLQAVICEVNNTFTQTHSYLCATASGQPINADVSFISEKTFHVSPFFPRDGEYVFRFNIDLAATQWRINIDYYRKGKQELTTTLWGKIKPMTKYHIAYEYLRSPFISLKVITLIHYQALKLWYKGAKFHPLPKPHTQTVTQAHQEVSCSKQ